MADRNSLADCGDLQQNNTENKFFNIEEVAKHNNERDCWVTIYDGVYDVSSFVKDHPGGKALVGYAGGDATVPFYMTHKSALALQTLKKHRIGSLSNYEPSPVIEGLRKLTDEFKKKGYFNCSKAFLIFQFTQIGLMTVLGWWLYHSLPGFLGATVGALVVAFAQGQAGWFMHDLGHFSVFRSMWMNRFVQYLVMNVYLGGSYTYWRNAHWKHHLFTNIEGWDHDLDTLPLFAWTIKQFSRMPITSVGVFQEYYWYILGPATSFWYIFYLGMNFYMRRKHYVVEVLGNVVHFTILYYLVGQDIVKTVLAHLYILMFLGMYMGHVFSLNHFPMAIEDKADKRAPNPDQVRKIMADDVITHQCRTTRDVTPHPIVDYLTGHLNYQVEHHIWPMMPRHNLPKVQPIFAEFCRQHGIEYQVVGVRQAFSDVFTTLSNSHKAYMKGGS